VLKRLEDDCLHRQQLHPSIKDRLARVRELAHPRIATLRTVERWNGMACLVWTYLDGETWDDAIAAEGANLPALCSALAATVDALHETGIVHGSLHGRNVIVRPDRQVWLTHVSPYLYTDPQVDIAAVVTLLREVGNRFSPGVTDRFTDLTDQLEMGRLTLREFSHLVLDVGEQPPAVAEQLPEKPREYRVTSILAGVAIMAVGIALWFEIHAMVAKSESQMPTAFPAMKASARQ